MSARFRAVHRCVQCKTVLSDDERFDSKGVCPYCGHITDSAFCDTEKLSVREGERPPAPATRPPEAARSGTEAARSWWSSERPLMALCAIAMVLLMAAVVSLTLENQRLQAQVRTCQP